MDARLLPIIEAILFSSDQPVKVDFIREVLSQRMAALKSDDPEDGPQPAQGTSTDDTELWEELTDALVIEAISHLETRYEQDQFGFEIRKIGGGYQFFTKRAHFPYIRKANLTKQRKRLSRAALETLSIIAYRQPITKAEVEFIRGVNCDYAVQKLLEKHLIDMAGRADAPGRPMLYVTSPQFLHYFGIQELGDLPKLKEFEELAETQIEFYRQGAAAPSEQPYYESEEKDTAADPGILGEDSPQEGEGTLLTEEGQGRPHPDGPGEEGTED